VHLDPLAVVVVLGAAALAVSAPDPTAPTIVPLAIAVGGLIGAAVGRFRRLPRPATREITENWAFAFGIAALVIYVLLLVLGV